MGPSGVIESIQEFGYPVCLICGQSVSPMSSDRQRQVFMENHQERHGKAPEAIGFYANVVADCITLPECSERTIAYSVLEAIRMAATQILDMHLDDLQILVIGHFDRDEVDAVLWDPMPGGSGLLDQILGNFTDVIKTAIEICESCSSACDTSCIDCPQTFRNSFYHQYLNRNTARDHLAQWGEVITHTHAIPPLNQQIQTHDLTSQSVNDAEQKLKKMLEAAGFMDGEFQKQIRFNQTIGLNNIGSTTPDVYFTGDEDDQDDKGVAVYLDGMSRHLHGDEDTAQKDKVIREWLRGAGYEVIEITFHDLGDKDQMIRHFKKLARYLSGKEEAKEIAGDTSWFEE